MAGLFGLLNLGAESLQVQQRGMEVTGHNLANVNNPAYARQRVNIATALAIQTPVGPLGTGAQIINIQQLRSALVDGQLQTEASVRGFLGAQQAALQYGESILGQTIDRVSSGPDAVGGEHGIARDLSEFFAALQSLSTNPTSLTERQAVVMKAQDLAAQFNQIDARLVALNNSLNDTVTSDVAQANELIASIANLNKEIITTENGAPGSANDLRDLRQQKIEALSKLVNITATAQANGGIDISISGVDIISGPQVLDQLETYTGVGGQLLVRSQTSQNPLTLTGGSIQGTIDARDGALTTLRSDLNDFAALLITEVNTIHSAGFSLSGSTGANFFTGTVSADIQVNAALVNDPALLQASGTAGAVGDNQVALALAQLSEKAHAALGNKTFSQSYGETVSGFGQALSSVNDRIADQDLVETMLQRQRDSISGVSLDEEMTNMMRFQKAFEASAHLITTIDEMLETVLNMKR